eukprot:scaffold190714_cov16-Tisochrysis_lutea.AAC.1
MQKTRKLRYFYNKQAEKDNIQLEPQLKGQESTHPCMHVLLFRTASLAHYETPHLNAFSDFATHHVRPRQSRCNLEKSTQPPTQISMLSHLIHESLSYITKEFSYRW